MSGDARGWNRCSECGRAAKPEDLEEWEHIELGLYGDLKQDWGLAHKDKSKCPARGPVPAQVRGSSGEDQ